MVVSVGGRGGGRGHLQIFDTSNSAYKFDVSILVARTYVFV